MRENFKKWMSEITSGRTYEFIHPIEGENSPDGWSESNMIYTHDYAYEITAKYNTPTMGHSYLGCQMLCRKARAGEDWSRGRDLPDGPLCQETWDKIKNAIINNELVKVAVKSRQDSGPNKCRCSSCGTLESDKCTQQHK